MLRSYSFEFRWRVLARNLIFSFLIVITTLIIGSLITFLVVSRLPGDPVLAYLPPFFTAEQYNAMRSQLGFDQPLMIQYFRFMTEFITGDWGISGSANPGSPVWDLIAERFPRMIEVLLLPTILGLVFGIIIGKLSTFFRKKWIDITIQVIFSIGISIPIFFLGMVFQYNFAYMGSLPAVGYKTAGFPDPPFVSGSRLLDSLISGQLYLYWDTVEHYLLPGIALTILITMLIARQTRVTGERKSGKKSVISNTISASIIIGLIFAFYFLIELVFNLHGISELFIVAIGNNDLYVARNLTSVIIIFLLFITFISNIIFSIIKSLSITKEDSLESETLEEDSSLKPNDKLNYPEKVLETDSKRDLKNDLKVFLKGLLKNPILLFGLIFVGINVFIAIFPLAITPYSFDVANGFPGDPWNPPSPLHPLGQTRFGRDILARVVWGTRDALVFGFGAIFIGLAGGLIFGFIGSTHKWVKTATMASMIPILIFPSIILIPLTVAVFGIQYGVLMLTIGIFLIPIFTRIIAQPPLQKSNVKFLVRKIVAFIPIALALIIFIYESIGFLGFSDPNMIQLGIDVDIGRANPIDASYASFWPGFTIFFIIMGFAFLHQGLKHHFQLGEKR